MEFTVSQIIGAVVVLLLFIIVFKASTLYLKKNNALLNEQGELTMAKVEKYGYVNQDDHSKSVYLSFMADGESHTTTKLTDELLNETNYPIGSMVQIKYVPGKAYISEVIL